MRDPSIPRQSPEFDMGEGGIPGGAVTPTEAGLAFEDYLGPLASQLLLAGVAPRGSILKMLQGEGGIFPLGRAKPIRREDAAGEFLTWVVDMYGVDSRRWPEWARSEYKHYLQPDWYDMSVKGTTNAMSGERTRGKAMVMADRDTLKGDYRDTKRHEEGHQLQIRLRDIISKWFNPLLKVDPEGATKLKDLLGSFEQFAHVYTGHNLWADPTRSDARFDRTNDKTWLMNLLTRPDVLDTN